MNWSSFLPSVDREHTGLSGAYSIAGIAVDVAGGGNIVAMFGQWGVSQLKQDDTHHA